MNILITGVAGFIGINLATKILKSTKKNIKIIGIDNLSNSSIHKLWNLKKDKRFIFLKKDFNTISFSSLEKLDINIIYHLASDKIPRYGGSSKLILDSLKGLKKVFYLWNKNKCLIIYASTSDVYGKNKILPFSEDSNFVFGSYKKERWAYASTKLLIENLIIKYAKKNKLKFNIVRFFGTYGPYQAKNWKGGPQALFIDRIHRNKKIEIHGDGTQQRCFTYIDDTVNGLIKLIKNNKTNNKIFNFGSNEEVSILEMAIKIASLMKKKLNFDFVSYSNFKNYEEVNRRIPDNRLAKKYLGVKFDTKFLEGIKKTINWHLINKF